MKYTILDYIEGICLIGLLASILTACVGGVTYNLTLCFIALPSVIALMTICGYLNYKRHIRDEENNNG